MAEALAVIGLVSSIVQFVEFSSKIIERLNEFQSGIDEVPQTFRDLKIQLPLLRETLKKTKTHAEAGFIDTDIQTAILNVVKGCQEQVELLDNILVKTLPATGDSRIRRGVKAFSSVGQEKDVQKILTRIQQYQLSLIHYQTTPATQALPTRSKPLFTVPFAQDPRFTGRQGLMDDIDKHFKIHRRVALAGLGGVGKSQIAIEYCYRFRKSHPQSSIMWIHASTVERIDQAYKEIARKAQLSGWDNPKTDKLTLVANWLSQDESGHWLIVLDNADDADVFFNTNHDLVSKESKGKPIASYIPHSTQGSVLITTRDRRVGERLANRVRAINVPPFTVQEAGDLFGSLVGEIDVGDEANAHELFDALAYLPLAVSQAAAFITENGITVSEYLELLRAGDADIKDLLSEELTDSRRDAETQNSVVQTWKLSFDHIRRSNPRAAKILSLMSVLDRQGIPKSLLRQDNEKSIEFTKAIGMLQAFSLITTENSGISFEIHRLVHLATQKWLELQGEMNLWREEALKVISEVYPLGIFENWAVCNSLSPHMQAVIEYTFDSKTCQLYSATLLSNALRYDLTQGRYDIALDKCTKALAIREDLLGSEHPDMLTSMANLASTYWNQGRLKEAEGLGVQVMETRKKVLGQEHPDTLVSFHNLAYTWKSQGRDTEAIDLMRQAERLRRAILGFDHPLTISSTQALYEWQKLVGTDV